MEVIARKTAICQGLKLYFTSKRCKRGHVESRYTSTGRCVGCIHEDYNQNKPSILQRAKDPARRVKTKEWKTKNRKRVNAQHILWRNANPEKVKIYRDALQKRRQTDIQFRLSNALRNRLCNAVRSKLNKGGSAVKDLGCSVDELLSYLANQFQPGMTWENWGRFGWHIDHKRPLSSFDLADREQLLEACHYSNLQPLWWQENISKGNRLHATTRNPLKPI